MNLSKLFVEKEPDVDSTLSSLSRIAKSEFGLITGLSRVRQYYDEPKFWHYSATINSNFSKNDGNNFHCRASGFSLSSEKMALLKCLGESIERYCNFIFKKENVSFIGTFNQIKDKALDPKIFSGISKKQAGTRSFKKFAISQDSRFRWSEGVSLMTGRRVLIPSQLIYLSYPHLKEEPTIYPGISTGAAGGSCLSAAIVRGIYEVIERDSFMIFYLNKLPAPKIRLDLIVDPGVKQILKNAERYKLKLVSLDLTSDLGIPVVATIVINRTGLGKAVSVGLKSDIDPMKALMGSINEALLTRNWLREEYEKNSQNIKPSDLLKNSDFKTRGLLWYPTSAIKNLDFWLRSKNTRPISAKPKTIFSGSQLRTLTSALRNSGYEIYYKDLMDPSLKNLKYYVVKVIVPQLQPLYLNEKYPLLGGKRLYEVPIKLGYGSKNLNEFNKYPHPFL